MKRDPLIEILKTEFGRKKARNKAYSLRSFSRDLEMDPSNLSKILSQQKSVGTKLRKDLAKKLGFESQEVENWTDRNYAEHNIDVFKIVADWQHYAILELYKIKSFLGTPKEISKLLGIEVSQAEAALKRLQETGLLKLDQKSKRWSPSEDSSSSILNVSTSKAHREQQKQIIEGAIDALEQIPIEMRSQSSMTMAIDTQKLSEAKALIKNFRRDLGRLLSAGENLNEVYQLSISLYPVTKTQRRTL